MTTPWREVVECTRCGNQISTETPVKTWIRTNAELDSKQHRLCVGDSDLWVQRYGTRKNANRGRVDRDVMYLMLVEIKTHGATLNDPQRDELGIVNDLLRTNEWRAHRNPGDGRFSVGHRQNSRIVYSFLAGRQIRIICYGVHTLLLSGSTPEDSELICWDTTWIGVEELHQILRFDVSPDTLHPLEHRNHKRVIGEQPTLFGVAEILRREDHWVTRRQGQVRR